MAEPTSKISRSKRGMRRSHDSLSRPGVSNCSNCGAIKRPHHVCGECGYYKGREIVNPN